MNDQAAFDKEFWEKHWEAGSAGTHDLPANPYLINETAHLPSGTALDAGCGAGAEALWLAEHGWQVSGADISRAALAVAAKRARKSPNSDGVEWIETDVAAWNPGRLWNLVVTSYAHPSIPQLQLYRRIADWVAPGGTLLIIAHLDAPRSATPHPAETTVTREDLIALFNPTVWSIDTVRESNRDVTVASGRNLTLHDVIVRAHRRH